MKATDLIFVSIILFLVFVVHAADDWQKKTPSTNPSARYLHSMAYIGSYKVLLFGGNDTNTLNEDDESWVYDHNTNNWTQKVIIPSPAAREEHAMAYIGSDKALLFGGDTAPGYVNDTWIYDFSENTWTEKNPLVKPSKRQWHAMSYIGDDKVLLFGGYSGSSNFDDTWVYDLSSNSWTDKESGETWETGIDKPSARNRHDMAYIGGDQVLLFGGSNGSNETWLYDLSENNWTLKTLSGPSPRASHAMAYIGESKVLLFGGSTGGNETWVYDLSSNTWSQDANSTQPTSRSQHKMSETSMDGSSKIVLFGGYDDSRDDETWTFGGGDYSLPIRLSSFSATAGDGQVSLKWPTQSEINNLGFIIERSNNNKNFFKEIASYLHNPQLKGQGNSHRETSYHFTDKNVTNGFTYYYKLIDVDFNGNRTEHGPVSATPNASGAEIEKKSFKTTRFYLYQNYPNPFNPETTIKFELPVNNRGPESVDLTVFNTLGEVVRSLYHGKLADGVYEMHWDGKDNSGVKLPSGFYFCRLRAGFLSQSKKLFLVR